MGGGLRRWRLHREIGCLYYWMGSHFSAKKITFTENFGEFSVAENLLIFKVNMKRSNSIILSNSGLVNVMQEML
jgi:hypothetical protein